MFALYPFPPTKVPVPVSSLVDNNGFIATTNKIGTMGEFPGGPVVRTQSFHGCGWGLSSGWGTKMLQAKQAGPNKKRKYHRPLLSRQCDTLCPVGRKFSLQLWQQLPPGSQGSLLSPRDGTNEHF